MRGAYLWFLHKGAGMSRHCVCYATDDGYLFPTLVSALQAREQVDRQNDIVICHVGGHSPKAAVVTEICRSEKIEFISVDNAAIDGMHPMFARMFLDRFLSPDYDHVLYVDGDTQISGSLDALLNAELPEGAFLAALDPMVLAIDGAGREWEKRRSYFASIGVPPQQYRRYFNSGVLRLKLGEWAAIRSECQKSPAWGDASLRFPDQDLLNSVCQDRCKTMSFKWNFPIFFLNCGVRDVIEPRLFHFMSNPRPWQGSFRPWGKEFSTVYADLRAKHPDLSGLMRPLPKWKIGKYWLQQHYKAGIESLSWNTGEVHEKVRAIEAEAWI
jgi:lipopolysaccharide biosynthesis glycosyltransferase